MTPHQEEKKIELPKGYELEVAGNNLLLKRPNGFLIAAFGEGAKLESIQRVAEADERYMSAVERQERFSSGADSETVLLFAEEVKEARTGFLLALEAAYREFREVCGVSRACCSSCAIRRGEWNPLRKIGV